VGTGKTALAETFGDAVAREADIRVALYALSLNARGTGAVGEMTSLLSAAFTEVKHAAKRSVGRNGKHSSGIILLIDEADALAQSRELAQMHHEDRAGVNALIRGVDDLATGNLPVIVVMCTNRVDALDPAVRRRAAATFSFSRPNDEQRQTLLQPVLEELGFSAQQIHSVVTATGPTHGRKYGHTYSDLAQRLLPGLLLKAYPSGPITFAMAKDVIEAHPPTPPFSERAV
jgi:AAA+ superfamily predicted ATPase